MLYKRAASKEKLVKPKNKWLLAYVLQEVPKLLEDIEVNKEIPYVKPVVKKEET